MLNYIRAELYKVARRPYTWIMLALILLGEGLMFTIWFDQREHMNFVEAVHVVGLMMVMGFFATIFTCDIVFAGQHQNGTLKNEVSFGLSRARIYLGKFITMTLLSIAAMVIALGVYLAVCRIMLRGGGSLGALGMVGVWILTELPVWLGCQAIICAASFLLNSAITANVVTLGVVIGSHFAVSFFSLFIRANSPLAPILARINSWLPYEILFAIDPGVGAFVSTPVFAVAEIRWEMVARAWIIGGFWFVLATVLGLYFFRQKEIK